MANHPSISCLENPMDRGAWRATVLRVTKSQTRLKQLSTHACTPSKKEELHGGQDGEIGQPPSSRSGLLCGCYEAL